LAAQTGFAFGIGRGFDFERSRDPVHPAHVPDKLRCGVSAISVKSAVPLGPGSLWLAALVKEFRPVLEVVLCNPLPWPG
jgi:hypothetical protein